MGTFVLQGTTLPTLAERMTATWSGLQVALYDLGVAAVVCLLGWGLGLAVSAVVERVLIGRRFGGGMRRLLGLRLLGARDPARFVAWAIRWVILGGSMVLAFDLLGLGLSSALVERMRDVLPRVLIAIFLMGMGVTLAMALGEVAQRFFGSAGVRGARLRGQIVAGLLTTIALLLALEQLGFAAQLVIGLGLILAGAAAIAVGLAFGLGCRDLARDFVIEYLRSLEDEPRPPA